jgi:RNA polymerase sigma-70 factor (ECF subfamily)
VRTPENAEEVLQDVLLKVWNKSTSYDSSKGRLYTWLLNIARNSSIDYTRSAKFKADQRNTELNTSFHDNAKLSTSENIKDSGLAKVLMGLDEKYRKIIELAYFNQYTQVEIVEELDIPLGTVKSRLRIAIRELRKLLGDEVGLLIILIVVLFLL